MRVEALAFVTLFALAVLWPGTLTPQPCCLSAALRAGDASLSMACASHGGSGDDPSAPHHSCCVRASLPSHGSDLVPPCTCPVLIRHVALQTLEADAGPAPGPVSPGVLPPAFQDAPRAAAPSSPLTGGNGPPGPFLPSVIPLLL